MLSGHPRCAHEITRTRRTRYEVRGTHQCLWALMLEVFPDPLRSTGPMLLLPDRDPGLQFVDHVATGVERIGPVRGRHRNSDGNGSFGCDVPAGLGHAEGQAGPYPATAAQDSMFERGFEPWRRAVAASSVERCTA